jgi:hypothetical protein
VSARPPAKKTAGQIEKETSSFVIPYSAVRCFIQAIEAASLIIKKPCHFGVVSNQEREKKHKFGETAK